MPNLRNMVDGVGSLQLNVDVIAADINFKVKDDVLIHKQSNRSGPRTSEVIVGRILAMGDDGTASITVQKPGGYTQRFTVSLNDLSPVTDSFRRQSIQFNNHAHRLA
jgi:hypothetical protein